MTSQELQEVLLQRFKVAAMTVLPSEMVEQSRVNISELAMWETDDWVARLTVLLYGKQTAKKVGAIYRPATWWQHFKQRWFSARLLRRWPVREEEITTETHWYNVCPHIQSPDKAACLKFILKDDTKGEPE